jgi:uncharacterized protein YbaP (TraB family)
MIAIAQFPTRDWNLSSSHRSGRPMTANHPKSIVSVNVRKFETVAEQLHAFADLPEDVQIDFLMEGVRELGKETETLNEMVAAWAAGDMAKLDQIMIEGDLAEMPEIYDALLVKRNANWVRKLDQLIKSEPGTFLVAVGAAHLIGKDSVFEMMKQLGYVAERVE